MHKFFNFKQHTEKTCPKYCTCGSIIIHGFKVLEGTFVIVFGGKAMVAKPESYQATTQLSSKDDDKTSSSTPVLAIGLGVGLGALAFILIIGIVVMVSQHRIYVFNQPHK